MITRVLLIKGNSEEWQKRDDQFCPSCGHQGVWLIESDGTFYNNDIGLCSACDTAWEWTYFSEEWTKQRTLRLRAKITGTAIAS